MRLLVVVAIVSLMAGNAIGQRHKLEPINSSTPDGKLLQQILGDASILDPFGNVVGLIENPHFSLSS